MRLAFWNIKKSVLFLVLLSQTLHRYHLPSSAGNDDGSSPSIKKTPQTKNQHGSLPGRNPKK
jgi:hypothetical protein